MQPAASVHDVAAYILAKCGAMSAMKLQKLVYYCQAWSLAWDDRPLFGEPIEAWASGPVVRALYDRHRGRFEVSEWPWGSPDALDAVAKESINLVLDAYAKLSAQHLSDLTHAEAPWRAARASLQPGERGSSVIGLDGMMEYYSSLPCAVSDGQA